MSSGERFGELRSSLVSLEDEEAWANACALLEAWVDPIARDEVAWPYAVDRLNTLEHDPFEAPQRLVRRWCEGDDVADVLLACGDVKVTPFASGDAARIAELLGLGLRALHINGYNAPHIPDDAFVGILDAMTPALERLVFDDVALAFRDLEPVRAALVRAAPSHLDLQSNDFVDTSALDLLTEAVCRPLESLVLSWNWRDYDTTVECFDKLAFTRLRELHLESVDIGSDGVEALVANPSLEGLELLDLNLNDLDDLSVERLTQAPFARSLKALDLGFNSGFGDDGLAALARAPMPALRDLSIASCDAGSDGFAALLEASWLPNLHVLDVSFCEEVPVQVLADLIASPALTQMRSLEFDFNEGLSDQMIADALQRSVSEHLTDLSFMSTGASDRVAHVIARTPRFASLRDVTFDDETLSLEGFRALLDSPHLSLTDFSASGLPLDAEHVTRLTQSGWPLRNLSLSNGSIDDSGLAVLAQWPGLAHVSNLHLRHNAVSIDGLIALLRSPHLIRLKRLNLSACDVDGDALAELVATSPALAALVFVDLTETATSLGDAGYRALTSSPHMANLEWLGGDPEGYSDGCRASFAQSPYMSGALRARAQHKREP